MKNGFLLAILLACSAHAMQTPPAPSGSPVASVSPMPSATPLPPPTEFKIPDDLRLFTNDPAAGGVAISPQDGKIEPFASFSITFPSDIVLPDKIDAEGAESPVVAWPPLDATFFWRSPASGDWMVTGPRIPGQTYRLRLREGLKALDGAALPSGEWGVELASDPMKVSSWYDPREQLNSRPVVPLEFNYPVRLHDAAAGVWFQDRATRKRFPAEILVGSSEQADNPLPTPTTIRATPRDPLPVGAYYDVVVENVRDAFAGRAPDYPRVFPLGTTRPLAVDFVAARNWATDRPHIEIKFKTNLSDDPLPPNAVAVEPAVSGLALRKDADRIFVDGKFDPATRYRVTISDRVTGDRGFPLAAASLWGATFPAKPPTILFPPGEFRQRASLGLRFALVQCNTGPLTWKLAKIPDDKLSAVREVLAREAVSGDPLLIDSLGLPTVAEGRFDAVSGGREELRRIEGAAGSSLGGPYLIEAFAGTEFGTRVANRSLIWFGDLVLTQKLGPEDLTIRVAGMGTGQPAPGVRVRLLTKELLEVASADSDANGIVRFPRTASTAATFFETSRSGPPTLWSASPDSPFPSGSTCFSPKPTLLGKILTDRPLYRPGQDLKIKGFLRMKRDGRLAVPSGESVKWEISKAWQDEVLASGTARVNASGGWDAAWTVPEAGDVGEFRVVAKLGAASAGTQANFKIEEFRNPPFSVACEPEDEQKDVSSVVRVASRYFHGAANVGARVKWKATWLSDHDGGYYSGEESDGFDVVDMYSQSVKPPVYDAVAEGESSLDGNGQATLTCAPPFPDPGNRAVTTVLWQIDVTGPDGQTITGGTTDKISMNEIALGVKAAEKSPEGTVRFDLRAVSRVESRPVPAKLPAALYIVKAKSVKEQIAPFVYRYRNFDDFIQLAAKDVPANGTVDFPAKEPGRYVLVAGPVPGGMRVSAEAVVTGPGESEFPVRSDDALVVKSPENPVAVGAIASFDVISPSGGIAWVTVETDRILDSRTVKLPGNATKIEIPARAEFGPNAWVSVYVLNPGGNDRIPGEMFGFGAFSVTDPATELDVRPQVGKASYEPREKVAGKVTVTSQGVPVADAEVTVYAVDDSILELGGWTLPALAQEFYPENSFNIITSRALAGLAAGIVSEQLTQKGFTVGDGGGDEFGNVGFTRKDFKPILFWSPSLKTGPDGTVAFDTTAPDNLTRFRVIALAQTPQSQFGSGSETFEVSKKLIIEPALPRFLRTGDEIELRAVARQKLSANEPLSVRCLTGLALGGPSALKLDAAMDAPAVVRFKARVGDGPGSVPVRFDVSAPGANPDSVEVTLPVLPRTITVNESVAGNWSGDSFAAADFMPAAWKSGSFDATLSTSAWLTKLMGLPAVLDYPHGCLEQQSSRMLVFTALGDLLKWLPTNRERDENYKHAIGETLKVMEASLLPRGMLPYWPMGTTGSVFVTIQSAHAVAMAEAAGFAVPERLSKELAGALQAIISRTIPSSPTLRAFAVYVAAQTDGSVGAAADELYSERDRLTYEGKAMLALAFHALGTAPDKQKQLVSELPEIPSDSAFDPMTFSSTARSQALRAMAVLAVDPASGTEAIVSIRSRIGKLMESSASLSTQENLWLLMSFKALLKSQPSAALAKSLKPAPDAVSPNKSAAAWTGRDLAKAADLAITGLGASAKGTFVLAARRPLAESENEPVRKGIRLDRMVKNLTDPARKGTAESPFRLGDELLITYRFQCDKPQSFLALEDALPAGVEVVNPNLALFAKAYQVPEESGVPVAMLSHSEMRDSRTDLFFDQADAGLASYSVLARATAAGTFAWPAAQISPMYDSRFYSRTAPATCSVTTE